MSGDDSYNNMGKKTFLRTQGSQDTATLFMTTLTYSLFYYGEAEVHIRITQEEVIKQASNRMKQQHEQQVSFLSPDQDTQLCPIPGIIAADPCGAN